MYREPLRWQTHLGQWVTDVTPSRVAQELRSAGTPVTAGAVYKWVAGASVPRPEVALQLVELSGGRLTFAEIYLQRSIVQGLQMRGATPGRLEQAGA